MATQPQKSCKARSCTAAQRQARLWDVLDQGSYGRGKLRDDPSTRSYVQDLDVARKAAIDAAEGEYDRGVELLPRLWRYSLLRCSLASQADNYPDSLFEALVDVGRSQEAIGLVELLTNTERKARMLLRLGLRIERQPEKLQESKQLGS
jgi:hypothetical protein